MAEYLTPKAFISYSWTSEEHVDWVVELAKRLKSNGVEVILDQWHLRGGQDKYVFMEKMVTDPSVTKVLCICDKTYVEKADARKGGVGTESQIISQEIYEKVDQEKFLPLIKERDETGKEYVPVFFKSRIYFDFSDADEFERSYDALLRNIFGKPDRVEPPLGKPPAHILRDDIPTPKVLVELARAKDAIAKEKSNALAMVDDYFDAFVRGLSDFRLDISGDEPFDEKIIKSIEQFTGYRDGFIDLILLIGQHYPDDEDAIERVASFFETLGPYLEMPLIAGSHREDEVDNFRFFIYELVVYAIACLIKVRTYAAAAHLLKREYVMRLRFGDNQITRGSVGAFNIYMEGLERRRQARLKTNRTTIAGDLTVQRATHTRISADNLVQADFLLYVHGAFGRGRTINWVPRVGLFTSGTLELFARATTPSGARAVETLLGIASVRDILTVLNDSQKVQALASMVRGHFLRQFSIPTAMNAEEIQRLM